MKFINTCMSIASLAIVLKNERRKEMNNNTLKGNLMSIICGVYMIVIGLFGLAVSLMVMGRELLGIVFEVIREIPNIIRNLEEVLNIVFTEVKETMVDFYHASVTDIKKAVEKTKTLLEVFVEANEYILDMAFVGLRHILRAMLRAKSILAFEARRAWDFRAELVLIPVDDEY